VGIRIHPHAQERMIERGTNEEEVISTVERGERFPAKFERSGFRRNFQHDGMWRGKYYANKQLEVYATPEGDDWIIIIVIAGYY
jgi:hypothetical protein